LSIPLCPEELILAIKYNRDIRNKPREILVHRKRGRGGKYARIFFLVVVTAFLTWYARQKKTNPFAASKTFHIKGTGSFAYIQKESSDPARGKNIIVLLSLGQKSTDNYISESQDEWSLVSFDTLPPKFTNPPREWVVLSPAMREKSVDTHSPLYDMRMSLEQFGTLHLRPLQVPAGTFYIAQWAKTRIFIIDDKMLDPEGTFPAYLSEYADLVVHINGSPNSILTFRNQFRPLQYLALPDSLCPDSICGTKGILSPSSHSFHYSFYPHPTKGLISKR